MPALPKGVDLRPSGAFRARFTYRGVAYQEEFSNPRAAAAWIQRTRSELVAGTYIDPDTGLVPSSVPTFATYAAEWLAARDLKPRTRAEYARMLRNTGPLDQVRLDQVDSSLIQSWYAGLPAAPTARRHHYALVRSILTTAVEEGLIPSNPARIPGAVRVHRRPMGDLPTPAQVAEMADRMPSDKYRVLLLVSAWCGLRFGEATELRRRDVVLSEGTPVAVNIRRGVTHLKGETVVGSPKSDAGIRVVTIPPHIRGDVSEYLEVLPARADRLLFPGSRSGQHLKPSALYKVWYPARDAVGLPSLRWHDLRHFSATTAARSGATLAELQARLGHSTVTASLRYQHASAERDAEIAQRMSDFQ